MPDSTKQSPPDFTSLEATRVSLEDELQSAKILYQEGLNEEAKRKLYQILISSPQNPRAHDLLNQIKDEEMEALLSHHIPILSQRKTGVENAERIIEKLNNDLGLELNFTELDPKVENWISQPTLSAQEHFDLGVAFFEMGCYRDAIRELKSGEKKIRIEQTFLGELGVAIVALTAECLMLISRAYEAKESLMPILNEPDLRHEEKTTLFYIMGRIEEELGIPATARGWYQKVMEIDPSFRDAGFRLKQLR